MNHRTAGTVLLLLSTLSASAVGADTVEAGTSWGLIFSPKSYVALADAPALHHGATALKQQLIDAGFAPERIVFLDEGIRGGKEAATIDSFRQQLARLTDAAGKNDLLFVAVASHGVQKDGCDLVCATDASAADLDRTVRQQPAGGLIPLQEIVRIMAMSASQKRFLLVDNAGSRSPFRNGAQISDQSGLADRFGSQPLQVPNGQWIVCSRSGRLNDSDQDASTSCFMSSVLDGLRSNADSNKDGQVSAFEISDYVQLYAGTLGYAPPVLHGKTNIDFALAATTEPAGVMAKLPAELRELLSRDAIRAGCASLLAEHDAARATWAFFEAEPYLASDQQTQENYALYLTALASMGHVDQALPLAKAGGVPLLVHISTATPVYDKEGSSSGQGSRSRYRGYAERPVAMLAAGTLLNVTEVTSGRLRFDRCFVRHFDGDELRYESGDVQSGWVDLASLKNQPKRGDSLELALNGQD